MAFVASKTFYEESTPFDLGVVPRLRRLSGLVAQRVPVDSSVPSVEKHNLYCAFDENYYLSTYHDVAASNINPLSHYLRFGWKELRDPNGWLSTRAYLTKYPELLGGDESPLEHMERLARTSRLNYRTITQAPSITPMMSVILDRQPHFLNKWRNDRYLALGLTDVERLRSLLHGFMLIDAFLAKPDVLSVLNKGLSIWQFGADDGLIDIRLEWSRYSEKEGEFSLMLKLAAQDVAVLSFNVLPGDILRRNTKDQLLISRMQTFQGSRQAAKTVTKVLGGVMPQAALFAAVQGVAQVFDIERFLGVPATRQVALKPADVERAIATYDDFWRSTGAVLNADGLYSGAILAEQKPLSSIGAGHKIRTRHKRELKAKIRDAVRTALEASGRRQAAHLREVSHRL